MTTARKKAPKTQRTSRTAKRTKPRGPVAGKAAVARSAAPRADFGAPVDPFFARQPAPLRAILDELRALVKEAAPDAESSMKWGMPWFTIGGAMTCALGAHRSHVNLILYGPPSAFPDPEGRLAGEGKGGRHLKLTRVDEIPRDSVRRWLRTAAELARKKR